MKPLTKDLKPGQFFYVVTPHPDDPKRKYLHSLPQSKVEFGAVVPKLSPVRQMAKQFVNLLLCRSYADFLNKQEDGQQFCVAVE